MGAKIKIGLEQPFSIGVYITLNPQKHHIRTMGLYYYRKTSSISRTKSQNFNVSCILVQLSPLNPLKPCAKLRMKM